MQPNTAAAAAAAMAAAATPQAISARQRAAQQQQLQARMALQQQAQAAQVAAAKTIAAAPAAAVQQPHSRATMPAAPARPLHSPPPAAVPSPPPSAAHFLKSNVAPAAAAAATIPAQTRSVAIAPPSAAAMAPIAVISAVAAAAPMKAATPPPPPPAVAASAGTPAKPAQTNGAASAPAPAASASVSPSYVCSNEQLQVTCTELLESLALVEDIDGAPQGTEPAPVTRSKHLLARAMQTLSGAPIDHVSQQILLLVRSLALSELEGGTIWSLIEPSSAVLFPFFFSFLHLLARPECAEAPQWWFAKETMCNLETFLRLLQSRPEEQRASRAARRDVESMLAELLPRHMAFAEATAEGEAAFESHRSPYHTETNAAADAAGSASSPTPSAFVPFSLQAWRRLRQHAACQCCRRLWMQEQSHWAGAAQKASGWSVPACECSSQGEAPSSCSCPTALRLLQSKQSPALAAHPLLPFFSLDLHHHAASMSVLLTSPQQLHFFTEKMLQLYGWCVEARIGEDEAAAPACGTDQRELLTMAFGYAALPDGSLRSLGMQLLTRLLQHQMLAVSSAHLQAPLLDILMHLLEARVRRGARIQAREEDESSARFRPQHVQQATKEAQIAEDQRLQSMLQQMLLHLPLSFLQPQATTIVQACIGCMASTWSLPLLHALLSVSLGLIRAFPAQTVHLIEQLFPAALVHLQRVHNDAGTMLALPVELSSFIARLATEHVFPFVSLSSVWSHRFFSALESVPVQSALVQHQRRLDEFKDMPQLEGPVQQSQGSTIARKNRAHGLGDGAVTTPSKRARKGTNVSPPRSGGSAAGRTPAQSGPSSSSNPAADTLLSSLPALLSLTPEQESMLFTLQPLLHQQLHRVLPDSPLQFASMQPAQILTALMELEISVEIIVPQLLADAAGTDLLHARLISQIASWLQWIEGTMASRTASTSTDSASPVAGSPAILRRFLAVVQFCVDRLPSRPNVTKLCSAILRPAPAESACTSSSTSSQPLPLSLSIAALQLLCSMPDRDLDLFLSGLQSSEAAIKCAAILLLPPFLAGLSSAQKKTRAPQLLQMLARMIAVPAPAAPAAALVAHKHILDALASSIGSIVCALSSTDANPPAITRRVWRSPFIRLRADDALFLSEDGVGGVAAAAMNPDRLSCSLDAGGEFDVETAAKQLVAPPPTLSQNEESENQSPDAREHVQLVAPLRRMLQPIVSRFQCACCDGTRSAASRDTAKVLNLKDLLPFFSLLDASQAVPTRLRMLRGCFRLLRHVPPSNFAHRQPKGGSAAASLASASLSIPLSPPAKSRIVSSPPRSKSKAVSAHEGFSLSQATGGSGKKLNPRLQQQQAQNSLPASLSMDPSPPGGSQQMDLDDSSDADRGSSGVEGGVVLHPLALHLLFLLFDAHESVRRCFVHQLQGWIDDDSKDGLFLALFNHPAGSPSFSTSLQSSPSFALFHSALVLVQSNWHLFPEWQARVKRALQSLSAASGATVQGVELSPAPGAEHVQDAACFHPSYLLSSYAAIGEVCLFAPLDSAPQHMLLWHLVDALSHAISWESHEVHSMRSTWKQLRSLMLHCFTRVAHRHRLSTSALFFLHGQYLFKQIFNPLNPSHPHLLRVLFDHLILRDGPGGPVIGEGVRPMDFFSEGVRMLLPSMMVDEFAVYCESSGEGAGTLQFLADLCTDDHSCRSMVLNHLDLILAHLLRSPTHHSMAFVYQKLQPYLGHVMHSQSHHFFSLIGLVHATLVFELIWRIGGGGPQRDQAMQALGWMMDVMKDSNKVQGSANSSVKNMLQKAGSAAAGSIQLSPASAQQAFLLTAPTPSAAQLADYLQPNFLGTFTKLNSLLTTTFPSSSRHAAPLHIPNSYKIHALHVLAALLTLSKDRLKGFIPKILASMQQLNAQAFRDATLASSLPNANHAAALSTPPLPFHLLCLWSIFIDTLVASGQMSEYLSTIVVTLVHTLCRLAEQQDKAAEAAAAAAGRPADSSAAPMDVDEHKSSSSSGSAAAAASSASAAPTMLFSMKDFNDYCSPLPTPRPPRSSNAVDLFYVWISSVPESMLEHALVAQPLEASTAPAAASSAAAAAAAAAPLLTAASLRSHCIAHLLSILRELLLSSKVKHLSSLLKTIPPLPSHPLLQPINDVLQSEFDTELKHRLSKMSKANPEPAQQGAAGSAASSSARKQAQRTAETLANASSLFLRVERLLATMVHEFAQVRTYSLKSLCSLLGDPAQRTAWDAYCSSEASAGADGSNERVHERVSQLVTALLQRCSDAKPENRQLASECLGEIGAIEPSQLSVGIHIKPPQYSFDHTQHYRTVYLSQYLIQNVLVRSLRGATDVATQDGMLCAIQELLKYCGIDEPVQQVAQNHSQALGSATKPPQPSAASRNALDDLMRLLLEKRTTPLLPHATLTEAQQLAQQYQAAQLWLGFNSDVRDVIQACLSSKFKIEDVYLRPQQPPAQMLGFKRDDKASEDLAALAGKKGSARKRKETSATESSAMELEDSGEAVAGKKKTTPERERKKHGVTAASATGGPAAAVAASSSESVNVSFMPASAGLTSANIIPLPSVPCFRPKQQTTLLQWLAQFTRYLIAYTALPPVHMGEIPPAQTTSASPSAISETLLYQACIGVVQSDIATGLFLLPYLVDHALRYGSDALRDFIKREIMAVLTACNQQHASASSNALSDAAAVSLPLSLSSSSSSSSSATQLCIQSVFELLDTLNAWWLSERRSSDLAKNASPGSASGTMSSAHSGTMNESARPGQLPLSYGNSGAAAAAQVVVPSMPLPASRSLESRKQFLDSIPKKALAAAAFHCKAYTRALKYQELHLREEKDKWNAESNKRMAAAQAAPNPKKGRATQTSAAAAAAEAASTPSSTAASELISVGMGAGLQTSDLDACQSMYGALEEPDGMRGLSSLRQKLSLQNEVRDLESVGLWSQALVLYEKSMQLHSEQTHLHTGLMECYRNLGQWEAGLTHAKGLLNDPALPTADQKQIAMYGVQYAWRLRDWSMVQQLLDSKEHAPDSVHFEVRLAALLLALHKGDKEMYVQELRRARSCVLSPLSAASWESYERAYPYLLQLQMIQEVEQMRAAMIKAEESGGARRISLADMASQASVLPGSPAALLSSTSSVSAFAPLTPTAGAFRESLHQLGLAWLPRLRRTPMTFRIREHLLSLRRVLYSEFHLNGDAGFGWWRLAELARDTSQLDVAQGALLHAQELGVQHLFIERAKLLRARGGRFEHDALMYLEREFGVLRESTHPTGSSQTTLEATFTQAPVHLKPLLATTSVLLGQWVQESSAKESNHVFKLYNQAIWMSPRMEAPHFYMGKLYDELLTAEINKGKAAARDDDRMRGNSGSSVASKSKHSYSVGGASPDVAGKFLHAILKCYGSALTHGNRFLFQALPRMLTLWFEHSEHWSGTVTASSQLKASVGSAHSSQSERSGGGIPGLGSGRGNAGTPQTLEEKFSQCHTLMTDLVKTLAPFQWLTAFPQIISRLTHTNKQVYMLIKEIIVTVFADYPQQAIWLLAVITRSLDAERLKRSKDIMGAVRRAATQSPEMLDKASQLFDLLFRLCTAEPKKPPRGNPPPMLSLARDLPGLAAMKNLPLIVPTQAQLTVVLPPPPLEFTAAHADAFVETAALTGAGGSAQSDPHRIQKAHRAFPSTQVMIVGFQDHVDILKSKERPKKVTFLGSDGKVYAFLAKREVKGDMRKNSRMMEFVSVVNRLLREQPDARSRQLQCRSFSVLPMTEECGIIEWVPNTTGLRHLVKATHDEEGIVTDFGVIKQMYLEHAPKKPESQPDVENEIRLYHRLCDMFRPVFHKWFLTQFPEPSAWFQARLKFARSSAVWSMVGYMVGLGDRHGENILIDDTSGDCVHVDFDCLFGKGLTLEKPERVPFRLTPNMIDSLGITGVEGLFTAASECAMQVMRSNQQTMMSVLHTFIYDPLVEWREKVVPNAGLPLPGAGGSSVQSAAHGHGGGAAAAGAAAHTTSSHNTNALRILEEIEMKLRGQTCKESLPLSVHGQVAHLIGEATSQANLAQMYIGWMAWL